MDTKEKKWCVYIHRNKINNKSYIGITHLCPEERWGKDGSKYKEDQSVFHHAINKYGWDNFEHIIWADNLSVETAKQIEKVLIALFKTNCCRYKNPECGYNMTDGGDGSTGYKHSKEIKIKMSILAKERCTDEWKERISQSAKERYKNPENHPMHGTHRYGELNHFYGKHHTLETKEKLKNAKIGVWSGNKNPNYGKGKPVIQLTKNYAYVNEYISSIEAEKQTNIGSSRIRNVCNHKPHYNTAGGFIWMYKDEYEKLINKGDNLKWQENMGKPID